jgi:polysaccharide biosynthesis/export protein
MVAPGPILKAQTQDDYPTPFYQQQQQQQQQQLQNGTDTEPGAQQQQQQTANPPYGATPTTTTNPRGQIGTRQIDNTNPQTMNQRRQTTPYLPPEPPTEFQRMVAATTGRQLPIFGASIFGGSTPSTFAPVLDIPVTPDYVIGPGDELRLQIWGQVNQQGSFIVDRTGAISVPQMGTIHVAGQRYDRLGDYLRTEFSRVYRNFNLNVSMGQLRSIQVFVVGQARRPGSYTISSLSTLLNALFASGGPMATGSLRDIQVRRGAQTVVHFDFYDLLLRGDKSKDVPLSPGDVIFIPAVGPQVALLGSVNNPGIYELKKDAAGTSVADLLDLGGGRTSIAAGTDVRLERIVDRSVLTLTDVDLSKPETTLLQNGDIVSVDSVVNRFRNAVTLRGNVANPGRYVWHAGMRISDLIPDKDSLLTRNYWERRAQLGQLPESYQAPTATSTANGMQASTFTAQGTQARNQQEMVQQGQQLSVQQGVQPNLQQSALQAQQQGQQQGVQQSTAADFSARRGATQSGPGGSTMASALTASNQLFTTKTNLILSAPDIDWTYAVIERQSATDLTTKLIPFNLGKVILDKDQAQNLELLPGDVVTIFSTSDLRVATAQQTRIVRLEGEFASAGMYSVLPGETLRQLLKRAGGFTQDAYLYGSEFTRESTRRVEEQRLNEYADELEAQVAVETQGLAQRAVSDRDQAAAAAAGSSARSAVARLRQIEPQGRIVLQLMPDSQGIDEIPDIALEDGDRFVVPRAPSSVNVEGQVYSANAFVFERGKRVKDYLKMAGGPGRNADAKRAFVLRADGSVFSDQYGNLQKATMFPGDTLVMPMKVTQTAYLRNLVDIATIVGQFGLGIAAINVLK